MTDVLSIFFSLCLFGFYDLSTFVGDLMPDPFLYKLLVLFPTNQFNMSTQFNRQKQFYFEVFCLGNSPTSNNSV